MGQTEQAQKQMMKKKEAEDKKRASEENLAEQRLVDDFCTPGIKTSPTKEQTATFVSRVGSMGKKSTVKALQKVLSDPNGKWKTKLRALCAIEALRKDGGMKKELKKHFAEKSNARCIVKLQDSTHDTLSK